jgi:ABC-type lipoprotein export system ATPase subunit
LPRTWWRADIVFDDEPAGSLASRSGAEVLRILRERRS